MSVLLIILMSILGLWAVLATGLALVWGKHLRLERQGHGETQEKNARYRAALKRSEQKAADIAAQFEALQRDHLELQQAIETREQEPVERPVPMVMIDSLDLSGEIGTLFEHVARVATAVRSYSAYTRGKYGPESDKARYDLLWLADCLHTYDRVGRALAGGSQRALSEACGELLSMYDMYLKDDSGYDSRDTFRRLSERVPLAGVIDAVRAINMKIQVAPTVTAGALERRQQADALPVV